jgi:AcrR family transcriptional regulator
MGQATRRNQILDAAARVFSDFGYHKAKIGDIAEKANVGKGTIYEYFASKRQLFDDTLLEVADMFLTEAAGRLKGIEDPRQKFRVFILFYSDFLRENQHVAKLLMRSTGEANQEIVLKLIEVRRRILDLFGSIVKEGIDTGVFRRVDPYYAAILFMGALQEAGAIVFTGQGISDDALDKMLDCFMYGISAKG